jgi:Glycosyltransferase family 87
MTGHKYFNMSRGPSPRRMLNLVTIGIWAAVLLAVWIRIGLLSHSHDVFQTYVDAGRKWTAGQPLYSYTRGFVYSPLVAAFFALFSWLPVSFGSVLWRQLTAAIFIWAIFWWLQAEINRRIPKSSYWLVFLLILPLSLGNFNNGQVNPMIIGLLMIAILAAHEERWTLSAVALGFSTYLKIYPLSVGLLLVLLYPRQLGWRLVLTLVLMGAFSFILQRPSYVLEQYQRWFNTRAADDRRLNMDIAPRDFAMLLQLLHVHLNASAVLLLQMLAGAGAAAICVAGRLLKWSEPRLLTCVFTIGTCWMLLFGPATEDATYAMIAPPLAFALVQAFHQNTAWWMRILVCASFAFLLLGLILNSFFSLKKTAPLMSVQPFGALLFASYSVIWVFRSALWKESES